MNTDNVNRRNFFSRTFAAIAALWCGSKVKAEGIPQNGAEHPESPFDWREQVGRSGPCRWCGEAARIRRLDVREVAPREGWRCYEPDGVEYFICDECDRLRHDDAQGGFLVPKHLEKAILECREQYGIHRQHCMDGQQLSLEEVLRARGIDPNKRVSKQELRRMITASENSRAQPS